MTRALIRAPIGQTCQACGNQTATSLVAPQPTAYTVLDRERIDAENKAARLARREQQLRDQASRMQAEVDQMNLEADQLGEVSVRLSEWAAQLQSQPTQAQTPLA